jgi:sugar phosphate permease
MDALDRTHADLRKRWLYVLPAVFVTYSLAYLDRANYGFGAAAGLAATLHISGYQSSLLGALFFLGYCLPQIPAVALMQRTSARWMVFGRWWHGAPLPRSPALCAPGGAWWRIACCWASLRALSFRRC